jgi:hypothetical protein
MKQRMHIKPRASELSRHGSSLVLWIAALASLGALEVFGQQPVTQVGTIAHFAITESSGLAASRRYPDVIWTHNDSSSNPFLFAIRPNGTNIRAFPVIGAALIDWEDLGIDSSGNLYIADIGANGMARSHVAIHRIKEPNPFGRVRNLRIERTWLVRFPGSREDCEGFFIFGGFGYLVTKQDFAGRVTIYNFPLTARGRSILLRRISTVDVPGDVTAAVMSLDASRIALLTDRGPVVYLINGNLSAINGLLVSAETREIYLFSDPPFQAR